MEDTVITPDHFRGLAEPLRVALARDAAVTVELRVQSVEALPAHRFRAEPFSLVLAGPPAPLLPQATYALRHPALGAIEVFLVPIGQDAESTRYEATFN
jgi:hypothetical protein